AGPCVSRRNATARPAFCASIRMRGTISRTHSWVAWLIFNRKTSLPLCISWRKTSVFSVAGPKVQMIFVLRMGLEDQVSHWKSQGAFHAGHPINTGFQPGVSDHAITEPF